MLIKRIFPISFDRFSFLSETHLMLSIVLAPVAASVSSATADMQSPSFMWLGATDPKAGALYVDNLFARGTNAEAFDAAESKSADRRVIFLKSSIFKYPLICSCWKLYYGNFEDTSPRWCSLCVVGGILSKKGFQVWAIKLNN